MKILQLRAENLKRLSAVEITPQGNLVRIAGKNDQGKSSVLDAILFALAGERAIEWEPVKRGEERSTITLDLGDEEGLKLRVLRRFTAKSGDQGSKPYTTSLTVEDAEGRRPKGPQALLDTIVGAIAFDPLAWARMPAKEQVGILRSLVTGVDFEAIARRRQAAYEDRTSFNRRAHEAKARASGIIVPPQAPDEPVDIQALTTRLAAIGEKEAAYNREQAKRDQLTERAKSGKGRLADLRRQIEQLEAEAADLEKVVAQRDLDMAKWEPLTEPEDRAPLVAEINSAHELNAAYAKGQQREQVLAEALEYEGRAHSMTAEIEECDQAVADAIKAAELPVRGLRFDDDGVYLDDIPFSQAADSKRLRVSMAIAMAQNPKLRVLRIKEGALLDEEAMGVLADVAQQDDWQLWVERVEDDSPSAIQIEDGRVKP